MGSRIRCFLIEPVQPLQAHYYLRRYHSQPEGEAACPSEYRYHNAKTPIGDGPIQEHESDGKGNFYISNGIPEPAHDDPRWPKACGCGFVFTDTDPFQLFFHQIYKRVDTGELMTMDEAPAGAMWNAWWIADGREYKGPGGFVGRDGICLSVKTPGGEWLVDGPANNGAGWTREGTIPDVTASPSILIADRYHGFLTAGYLVEC